MGDNTLSDETYREVKKEVNAAGSTTHAGEQRLIRGEGIHPYVDPSKQGVIRLSLPRMTFNESMGLWVLNIGPPIMVENRVDGTGSMGRNIKVIFDGLPKQYRLLKERVLKPYDVQIANGVFQDIVDTVLAYRSQAEMDVKIARQLTFMPPEHGGGDFEEDPQYHLFGGAFLARAFISGYGLKPYDFSLGDAPGRDFIDPDQLVRVYGEDVYNKLVENGFQIDAKNLPSAQEVGKALVDRTHAFFLQVGDNSETGRWWKSVLGRERVVRLPNSEMFLYVQAAIIGLTESLFDLQTLVDFLREAGLDAEDAKLIRKYVSHIPIGAQAALQNFGKLPKKGDRFTNKHDLWPIDPKKGGGGGEANAAGEQNEIWK